MDSAVIAEAKAARSSVALCKRAARGKIIIRGGDRKAVAHNLCTNHVKQLQPGQGCRAEHITQKGHIVADLRVYVAEEEILLDTDPGHAARTLESMAKFVIMEDASFEDRTDKLALFTVSGPGAAGVLQPLLRDALPQAEYSHVKTKLGNIEVRVVRSRWTGETDYDLYVVAVAAGQLHETLRQAVKAAGGVEMCEEVMEVLRIEAGIARLDTELLDAIPWEANLAEAVSLDKGCYLGQEIIARVHSQGRVNRLLCGLVWDGDTPAPAGCAVMQDGRETGKITSCTWSPSLAKTVALAYVRRDTAAPGTVVSVESHPATVAALPLVKGGN